MGVVRTGTSEARHHLAVVQAVVAGRVRTGYETFDAELPFNQLRKTLELIAFGSLRAATTIPLTL